MPKLPVVLQYGRGVGLTVLLVGFFNLKKKVIYHEEKSNVLRTLIKCVLHDYTLRLKHIAFHHFPEGALNSPISCFESQNVLYSLHYLLSQQQDPGSKL